MFFEIVFVKNDISLIEASSEIEVVGINSGATVIFKFLDYAL